MTLNVLEVHLVTDSDAKPIGFSSVDFKGISGAWVGSISSQAVVRRSVVWGADVSANVYDAAVAANPNEIKGKQHSLDPEGTYFWTVGDEEQAPTLLQIRSAGQSPVTELRGIGNLHLKPDVFDFDTRRVVAVAREIYVNIDASGDDYKGQG